MRTIVIADTVDDPARAKQMVSAIKSLRNRASNVRLTIEDFAVGLGGMLGISSVEVLNGLDTETGIITINND